MKKQIISIGIIAILLGGIGLWSQEREVDIMKIFHSISSHDVFDYAVELSKDKYNGRLSGTPEYIQAAEWVASYLSRWGIQPYGDDGTYFQFFEKPFVRVKNPGSLVIGFQDGEGSSMSLAYSFPDDYFPGTNSASGTAEEEVIYTGYGITAPELGYDDYQGIDVRGKIVMIDSGVPFTGEDEQTFIKWVPYSFHQFKLDNAAKHGAAGLLYIGKGANPNTSYNDSLIYCHIDSHVVEHLFFGTGKTHESVVESIQNNMKPASFVLKKQARITAETEYHSEGRACNVIGLIEGSDPLLKQEVIIFGGHLDGVGNLGLVMPGALDNASGVADIMGAAKALAALETKPKRSIIFLFIGGEECNLLGSRLYCEHPKFPLDKTIAFFNLDMVGNGSGLSVGGGLSYPRFLKHFKEANDRFLHRQFRSSESRKSLGRPRSDSVIFSRAGFRTLSIGTSGRVKEMYYHDPRDTAETLTPEIMEDVAKLIFLGALGMADDPDLLNN